jgi:hypothetical protein
VSCRAARLVDSCVVAARIVARVAIRAGVSALVVVLSD